MSLFMLTCFVCLITTALGLHQPPTSFNVSGVFGGTPEQALHAPATYPKTNMFPQPGFPWDVAPVHQAPPPFPYAYYPATEKSMGRRLHDDDSCNPEVDSALESTEHVQECIRQTHKSYSDVIMCGEEGPPMGPRICDGQRNTGALLFGDNDVGESLAFYFTESGTSAFLFNENGNKIVCGRATEHSFERLEWVPTTGFPTENGEPSILVEFNKCFFAQDRASS